MYLVLAYDSSCFYVSRNLGPNYGQSHAQLAKELILWNMKSGRQVPLRHSVIACQNRVNIDVHFYDIVDRPLRSHTILLSICTLSIVFYCTHFTLLTALLLALTPSYAPYFSSITTFNFVY